MPTVKRRIAALKARASDDSTKIIILEDGETQTAALQRMGLMPGALRVVCITSLDARLQPALIETNQKPAACGFSFVWCKLCI